MAGEREWDAVRDHCGSAAALHLLHRESSGRDCGQVMVADVLPPLFSTTVSPAAQLMMVDPTRILVHWAPLTTHIPAFVPSNG